MKRPHYSFHHIPLNLRHSPLELDGGFKLLQGVISPTLQGHMGTLWRHLHKVVVKRSRICRSANLSTLWPFLQGWPRGLVKQHMDNRRPEGVLSAKTWVAGFQLASAKFWQMVSGFRKRKLGLAQAVISRGELLTLTEGELGGRGNTSCYLVPYLYLLRMQRLKTENSNMGSSLPGSEGTPPAVDAHV